MERDRTYFEEVELKDARRIGWIDGALFGILFSLIVTFILLWAMGVLAPGDFVS